MYALQTRGKETADDGKHWFQVEVSETYHQTYVVRALDENDAADMINDLINEDEIDPSKDGEYERSVNPFRMANEPSEGQEYWEEADEQV